MTALYIHDGGRVACVEHMGAEGEAAARHWPNRKVLRTPLGSWDKVTLGLAADWFKETGALIDCDTCGATP